jgi:hypothetical protein
MRPISDMPDDHSEGAAGIGLGAQSVRTVLHVAGILLVCFFSIAAMVWLAGERMSMAPLWAQLLAVPAVAGIAFWALHVLFPDDAPDE